jgi:hypothetical protein
VAEVTKNSSEIHHNYGRTIQNVRFVQIMYRT